MANGPARPSFRGVDLSLPAFNAPAGYRGGAYYQDPHAQTLIDMMMQNMQMGQRHAEREQQRSAQRWNMLANMPTQAYQTYLGVKDQQRAEEDRLRAEEERERLRELEKAQAQATQDALRIEQYTGLPLSLLKTLPGVTTTPVESVSPTVDESSYTPQFKEISARRAAQGELPPVETIGDMMLRDESRLVEPAVALPRPDPRTYAPRLSVSSGHPDIPDLPIPIETAGIQQQIASEEKAAEAQVARDAALDARAETLWEKGLERPQVATQNVYIEEDGDMVPRIIKTTTSFDPTAGGYVSESSLMLSPDGSPVTHEVEDSPTLYPDGIDDDGNIVYVNRQTGESFPSNVLSSGVVEARITAEGQPETPEVAPVLSAEAQGGILAGVIESVGAPFTDSATVIDIINDPQSETDYAAITGLASKPLQKWQEFTGYGETPRKALARLRQSLIGLLNALSDDTGQPSERERARILRMLENIRGSTFTSGDALKTTLGEVGTLLRKYVRTNLGNIPAGDSATAVKAQQQWRATAGAAENFAHNVGLPSVLGGIDIDGFHQRFKTFAPVTP